jgi:molecular chaperone DnaK
MSDILGIDLGTTNSLVGVMDAGFPLLIADAEEGRLTPSVVYFPAGSQPVVGRPASRMRMIEPTRTVYSIKRFMGRRVGEEADDVAYPLAGERGQPVRVAIQGGGAGGAETLLSPEQVSALVLGKLKEDAERAMGRTFSRAVITVPAYFNDAQRNATKMAGELAGFTVERIVNEPTAAALAYGLDRLKEKSKIAVYDLGGGTFDISILELNQGVFQVISTNGNTRLGGDDIDAALIQFLLLGEENLQDPAALARVREAAIAAKHRLSTEEETAIDLPFLKGDRSFSRRLSRADLEKIARPILERTRAHCLRSLADAKLTAAEIDQVILVGGQTRMPLARQLVAEIFQQEPSTTQNPDEAIALGATIQGGILAGAVQNMVLLDITPLSLGIETFGGLMNVIIPRNSTIPCKAGEMFTNAMPGQSSMKISVLQGEREMARDNWPLGQFDLEFESAPKGQARVGVQFEIDANGILHVLARDVKTGREKIVEIQSAVDVSDEAIEQMIADSLENAFEDMSQRVFTEARLKAEEMLPAVEKALGLVGSRIAEEERRRIESCVAEVKAALEAGAAPRLKQANAALDETTQSLAALLMERAMGTHL